MVTTRQKAERHWAQAPVGVLALALTLLFAQVMGLMHVVVHAPSVAADHQWQPSRDRIDGVPAADVSHGLSGVFAQLFSGHQDDSDCRAYDQLSHGDAMPGVPVLALLLVFPVNVLPLCSGEVFVRPPALFEARAPPPVR